MNFPHRVRVSLGSIEVDGHGGNIYEYMVARLKFEETSYDARIINDRENDICSLEVNVVSLDLGIFLQEYLNSEFDNVSFGKCYDEFLTNNWVKVVS